jgi:hypothetical protein
VVSSNVNKKTLKLSGKRAQRNALESFEGNGCAVVVAAA